MTKNKIDLKNLERELQQKLREFIRRGDQDSDQFWKVRDQLSDVQLKLYAR